MLFVPFGNKFQQTHRVYSNSLPNLTIITYLFWFVKSFFLVGTSGLEPPTSRLSGVRSNHLSYAPSSMEMTRIELVTPCLQGRCSPIWATPPCILLSNYFDIFKIEHTLLYKILQELLRFLSVLLRKEVIQPHLPIRLPCYDFTPVINPTFDDVLLR